MSSAAGGAAGAAGAAVRAAAPAGLLRPAQSAQGEVLVSAAGPAAAGVDRPSTGAAAGVPLLELRGLTKRFGPLLALDSVDLEIRAGEVHCLLGENGAGKSTLCNLVFGVHAADAGEMLLAGAPHRPQGPADALARGVAMVHQHFSLVGGMTVVDNLLLGQERGVLRRRDYAARIAATGAEFGLEVRPGAKVEDLSVGERQRVEIVKCLMRRPRLLVLDEPTAVLLPAEIDALLAVCRRVVDSGCAVVLVTHKLAEIKRVADRVTVLRAGRTVARSDSPARDIDMLVRAMIQRDLESLDRTMSTSLGVETDAAEDDTAGAALAAAPMRPEAARIEGLRVLDAAGAARLEDFTLSIGRGEIVGLAGVEGNGQTELGDAIAGLVRPAAGRFLVAGRDLTGHSPRELTAAGVGVVPQDRHAVGCIPGMSLAHNLYLNRLGSFARGGLMRAGDLDREARALMQRFDVRAAGPEAPFSSLSGGNQQKAVLARELTIDNLVFLLAAQPTRGLDVGAVESVFRLIRGACEQGAGVLLISSELDELIAVADRIVVLYRGRIMGERPASPAHRNAIGAMMAGHG